MNTRSTCIIIAVLSVLLTVPLNNTVAQTVTLTPEQREALLAQQREHERQLAQVQRLADAQRRVAEMEANVQRQAMQLAEQEAARADIAAKAALADTMLTATKAGWEKAVPEVQRRAHAVRLEMAKNAIESWTPPSGYRYERSAEAVLENPFGDTAARPVQVAAAPSETIEQAVAKTCLEIDPEMRVVRVGTACGESGFDGRLAAGLYPVTADGHLLDTPERARLFIAQAAASGGTLMAYSPVKQQVILIGSKGGRP